MKSFKIFLKEDEDKYNLFQQLTQYHKNNNVNSHLGSDIEQVHSRLVKDYKGSLGYISHMMQEYRWGGGGINIPDKRHYSSKGFTRGQKIGLALVDKYFSNKRNGLKYPLTVYHGMNSHPDNLKDEQGNVKIPGYASTSIDPEITQDYTKSKDIHHVLKIDLPQGHPGHYLDPGEHPFTDEEKEFNLPKNTKLKLHPQPTIFKSGNQQLHLWHATPIENK